jgi:hypothetical protein
MKKATKSLQKFTESEIKINNIFALEIITKENLNVLSKEERKTFNNLMADNLNELKDLELDKFIEKTSSIFSKELKNQLWERNHTLLINEISSFIYEYCRMPISRELADKTGLSRQTIHKHMKEYEKEPLFVENMEQFKFMNTKLLSKVCQLALKGDIGACKLYFNLMGCLGSGNQLNGTRIENQNNYIQINGMVLSQDSIKNLNPEQLESIETILKTALPNIIKNE